MQGINQLYVFGIFFFKPNRKNWFLVVELLGDFLKVCVEMGVLCKLVEGFQLVVDLFLG